MLRAIISLFLSPIVFVHLAGALMRRKSEWGSAPLFSFSQVIWDDVWQRPQEFAWRASEEVPVVYCSPVQVHNWLFSLGRRWKPVQVFGKGRQLVVLSPLILSGHYKSAFVFRLNCWIIAAHSKSWLGSERVRCVVNTPFAVPVLGAVFPGGFGRANQGQAVPGQLERLVYDVIDDFTAFDWAPEWAKGLDRRLLEEADAILTGTYELLAARKSIRPDTDFVACGVDFEGFNSPKPEPADLGGLQKPTIGYFGTISERVDLELIAAIATKYPEASVVLIGPVHFAESELPRAANIHYLGLKRHDHLPAYAQAFAVGLIPFRITEATLKLNPVKTLEYLAAGVPVVSTAIPDVERFFSTAVSVARSQDEFVLEVGKALSNPNTQRREIGLEMARTASWQEMTRRMMVAVYPDGHR